MKYFIGFCVATTIMIIGFILVAAANLKSTAAAHFFIGWVSCTGYNMVKDYFESKEINK